MNKLILVALVLTLNAGAFAKDIKINLSETIDSFFPDIRDVVIEAYSMAGHNVEQLRLPGERALAMFEKGEIDADIMRLANFTDSAPNAVAVPVVLTNLDMIALVKADSPFTSNADLVGKKMSATRGTKVHTLIASKLSAQITEQNSFESSAKMVAAGRVDFLPVTAQIAKQFMDAGMPVKVINEPLVQIPFYTWVTSENADIVPGVEAALKELKAAERF